MTRLAHGTVRILMYHGFAPALTPEFHRLTIAPSLFDEHVAALREAGFRLIAVRDVPEALRTTTREDRLAVISIDDGLDCGLVAGSILAKHGAPATFFIPTAFVGGKAQWLEGLESERPMMDWRDLVDLAKTGMEIGSHGHGHIAADLNRASLVRADAQQSREALEEHLGTAITSYAYPFGYQRRKARQAIAAAGFECACAIVGLSASAADDVFALPRLAIFPDTTAEDLVTLCLREWPRAARFEAFQRQRAWTAARRVVRLGPESAQKVDPSQLNVQPRTTSSRLDSAG